MASSTSGVRPRPTGERLRSGLLTTLLLLPAGVWYLVLLVAPLVIIIVFSFGTRARNGG
jgi:spermidine/putrescine transport system permease protein